jgi:hypothetical protein
LKDNSEKNNPCFKTAVATSGAQAPSDSSLLDKRIRLDHLLADYYDDICEAARIKVGLKYHLHGEKPTKYFSALLKQRSEKSSITSLSVENSDGSITVLSTIEEFLEMASGFYASLYSKKLPANRQASMIEYMGKNSARSLESSQRKECDKPISVEELESALKKLPSGSAPGIDGLPAEFLRFFWDELKDDFHDVLIESFNTGMLPETMKASVVTLIYKKKSRQDIRNHRPISLLCSDYKIIAKVMAEKLKGVLPNLIQEDQTGFVKDRYVGENIMLFLDVQAYI